MTKSKNFEAPKISYIFAFCSSVIFLLLHLFFSDEERAKKNPMYTIRKANKETESTLAELEKTYKEPVSIFKESVFTFQGLSRNLISHGAF